MPIEALSDLVLARCRQGMSVKVLSRPNRVRYWQGMLVRAMSR